MATQMRQGGDVPPTDDPEDSDGPQCDASVPEPRHGRREPDHGQQRATSQAMT